jgi:hypothetical protein
MSSFGSTLEKTHANDDDIISSPYGDIPRYFARRACGAEYVAIVTVEGSTSYVQPEAGGGSRIMSNLTMNVERVLHGTPPTPFVLTVPGGTVNGVTSVGPSFYPRPHVGRRYAVACSTLSGETQYLADGAPVLHATVSISADIDLP